MNYGIKLSICLALVLPEVSWAVSSNNDQNSQSAHDDLGKSDWIKVDQIKAVVYGSTSYPITDTDCTWKRDLNNHITPFDKQVQTYFMVDQIDSGKVPMDPSAAEKYVENIKRQHNLSDGDLATWFSEVGCTIKEGLESLINQYKTEYFKHTKFKSQLIPTDTEIEDYYKKNPQFEDGYFDVRATRIELSDESSKKITEEVDKITSDPENFQDKLSWSPTVRWSEEDLTDENKFVTLMKVGEIKAVKTADAYELYQLIESKPTRLKSLQECRSSIVDTINEEKLKTIINNYNASVKDMYDVMIL